MIPSLLLGLALLVVLLASGLAFALRRRRVVQARAHSAFREALRVVFVSVACLLATSLIAAGIRWLFPADTPNVNQLMQDPSRYGRAHYVQLAWWALLLLVIATALGAVAADLRVVRISARGARWTLATLIVGGWLAIYGYWLATDAQPDCSVTTVTQTGSAAYKSVTRNCSLPDVTSFVYVLAPVAMLLLPDAKSIRLGVLGVELRELEGASKVVGAVAKGDTPDDSVPADDVLDDLR